jgi:hypothetical protein
LRALYNPKFETFPLVILSEQREQLGCRRHNTNLRSFLRYIIKSKVCQIYVSAYGDSPPVQIHTRTAPSTRGQPLHRGPTPSTGTNPFRTRASPLHRGQPPPPRTTPPHRGHPLPQHSHSYKYSYSYPHPPILQKKSIRNRPQKVYPTPQYTALMRGHGPSPLFRGSGLVHRWSLLL